MRTRPATTTWAPWVVGLAVFGVVAWRIWVPGVWSDEAVTLTMAQRSWPSLLSTLTHIDAVHGVYYAVMHLWLDVVGYSPFTLRLPSAVFVALTSVVVVRLGAALWNQTAGVVAGLVYAAVPRASWMATEARPSALATLAIAWTVWLLVRAFRDGRTRQWVWYGAALTFAIHVFMYNVLMVPVFVGVALAGRPAAGRLRGFWVATVAASVLSLPLLVLAVTQREQLGWVRLTTLPLALRAPLKAFLYYPGGVRTLAWVALIAACVVALVWVGVRRGPAPSATLTVPARLVLVAGWLVFPIAVLLVVGRFLPLYVDRYLSISTPALALVIGAALGVLGARWWQSAIVLVLVAVLASAAWLAFRAPDAKDDTLEVVTLVESNARDGDAVLFVGGTVWDPRFVRYAYPASFARLDDFTLDAPFEDTVAFFGASHPLADVLDRLDGRSRVIVVAVFPDAPGSELAADMRLLTDAGFRVVSEDSPGIWRVTVLDR